MSATCKNNISEVKISINNVQSTRSLGNSNLDAAKVPCTKRKIDFFLFLSDLMSKFQTSCRHDELLEVSASFFCRSFDLPPRLWTRVPRNTAHHQAEMSYGPPNSARDRPSARLTAECRQTRQFSRCRFRIHQEEWILSFLFF